MLGRSWSVEGVVETGQKLGRTIGFPTANLTLGEVIEPKSGVYAVVARTSSGAYPGVANFGRRPTVGSLSPLLESHLFDFSSDLYGRLLEVFFVEFIRDERKFDGLDALKAQIAADCEAARRIHARAN
jgi:riboflavin kinase/FMN adenylyltransferase